MMELISEIAICLIISAILGIIIGYLIAKKDCTKVH